METINEKNQKKGYSLQEKHAIIESWKQSGKSKMDFCKETAAINYRTLVSWTSPGQNKKKTIKKAIPVSAGFSELKISSPKEHLFAALHLEKRRWIYFNQ